MYRSWAGLVASGLLAGVAAVSLFAGFGTPWLLAVAVVSGVGSYLAYRYAADRMVASVYAEVGDPRADEGQTEAADGGTDVYAGTAEGVDSTTAASSPSDGEYDEWTWAEVDADDPFWSDDEDDWEDPWETNTTAPDEASNGDWRKRRAGDGSDRGRWWEEHDGPQDRRDGGGAAGVGGENRNRRGSRWWERMGEEGGSGAESGTGTSVEERSVDRTEAAYEVLGLEPGAGPEAVRAAYRERVKEAHPDTPGGSSEEFIRVREAYEYLRERLSGTEGPAE